MNNRRYPSSLFVIGVITNIVFHFFWLFVPAIILLLIGIFAEPCFVIGTTVLVIDVLLSLIEQIRIRNAFLQESDNPSFKAFQDVLSKDGNWRDNMADFVNHNAFEPQDQNDSENEDK